MYIQQRRDPSVKFTSPYPRINSIKEITRFITTVDGEPKFTAWSNDEIRLKSLPSESDLRSGKIDLNSGFDVYWNQHLKDVHHPIAHKNHPLRSSASQNHLNHHRLNNSHSHHMSSLNLSHLGHNVHHPGMEKDDFNRKTFEATLKWLKKAGYFRNKEKKPKLVTTSSALYLMLQLPYEKDEKAHTCWLVSKYNGTLFLSSIENYTSPVCNNVRRGSGQNNNPNHNNHHQQHRYASSHNLHANQIDPLESDRSTELTKYRWRLFNNLMTTDDTIDTNSSNKLNRCVVNSAMFNGYKLIYSATINAVNESDEFVDIRLSVPQRNRREHLIKLQKLWAIAVVKPAVDIILGTRSTKNTNNNNSDACHIAAPEGRLIKVEKINVKRIPADVYEYSMKSCSSPCSEAQGLWNPRICFDFLRRLLDFLDHRCVDDPSTVYQLTPEGYFGRGFSVLQIHKVNTQGCDTLIPEWFVQGDQDEQEEQVDDYHDDEYNENCRSFEKDEQNISTQDNSLDNCHELDHSINLSDIQCNHVPTAATITTPATTTTTTTKIPITQVSHDQHTASTPTNGHQRDTDIKNELEEGITEITVEEEMSYYLNCYLINED